MDHLPFVGMVSVYHKLMILPIGKREGEWIMDYKELASFIIEAVGGETEGSTKQKRKIGEVIMELTSAVFSPILPELIGIGTVIMAFGTGPLLTFFKEYIAQPFVRKVCEK